MPSTRLLDRPRLRGSFARTFIAAVVVVSIGSAAAQDDGATAPEASPQASAKPAPKRKPPAPTKPKPTAAPKPSATEEPKPVAQPSLAPAAPADAGKPAAGPPAADPSKPPQHVLQGEWIAYWYGVQKVTPMNIAQASGNAGITTFMGGIATLDNEACAVVGTVLDNAEARYEEGPAAKALSISAYVMMRAQCKNSQIWIEAFGLPAGKVLMSGRATILGSDGKRSYAPIAFGRTK
jgi:hypothetical protein